MQSVCWFGVINQKSRLARAIFGINHPRYFRNFETDLTLLGQFQNFEKYTGTIHSKSPSLRLLLQIQLNCFSVKLQIQKGH